MPDTIIITGAAGFIGYHTSRALLERGDTVIGIDNMNDYYDVTLKQARLTILQKYDNFTFYQDDVSDHAAIQKILNSHPDINQIMHLAAQAGVRYSLENPHAYSKSNLDGHLVMLEAARSLQDKGSLRHFVYASSSSVYGANKKQPFSVSDDVSRPVSLYAATKRAAELMTQSYCHLYKLPATGLRFFTVYGPMGRPDMAYFIFTRAIENGDPIKVYNQGNMKRDFTWIGDCVSGILSALDTPPKQNDAHCLPDTAHRIFNLGHNKPEKLMDFIHTIENALGKEAIIDFQPMAPGDVAETYADIDPAQEILNYKPSMAITKGIPEFVKWYKDFY